MIYAAPGKPSKVKVIENFILIWQEPDTTNGNITGYDVYIEFVPFHEPITILVNSHKFYYVFRQNDIPENVTAEVQVCT